MHNHPIARLSLEALTHLLWERRRREKTIWPSAPTGIDDNAREEMAQLHYSRSVNRIAADASAIS